MLDRRAFLRRLGFGTVAAAAASIGVFDVERLLWLPGEKTIFVPTLSSSDTFETANWLSREALRHLTSQIKLTGLFNRSFDERFSLVDVASVHLVKCSACSHAWANA